MNTNIDTHALSQAGRIFYYLLENKVLTMKNDKSLYDSYSDTNVKIILDILAEQADCTITMINNDIYLLPGRSNFTLGYTGTEIKNRIFSHNKQTSTEYYLAQFIIQQIVVAFYSSTQDDLARIQLSITELENMVTDSLQLAAQSNNIDDLEDEAKINFIEIIQLWSSLKGSDDVNSQKSTKVGYLKKVINFLSSEGLLQYFDDGFIKPTKAFTDKMSLILSKNEFKKTEELFEDLKHLQSTEEEYNGEI